jgi:aspartate kinase
VEHLRNDLLAQLTRVRATTEQKAPAALANGSSRPGIVVMKFGGTSIADPIRLRRAAERLVAQHSKGDRVVGVLSAMGTTTDELLDLARDVSPNPDPRELDLLVSVGERISCALCAMAIQDLGVGAISLTGDQAGIVTDGMHGKAKITDIRGRRIHDSLERGQIVLVAGFQGASSAQEVTTLGRGGSDMTAVALAAALGARACEIFSDVSGVFTADPQNVPEARRLDAVSYGEMLELASSGAQVLQLRSVEFARHHNVKVHVRSAFDDSVGTWVVGEDDRMFERAIISGVTHTLDETVYHVEGVRSTDLFAALAHAGVNVDTILLSGKELVFSASPEDRLEASRALDQLGSVWSARIDLGKVSLVGAGMKSHPGIAAKTFAVLADAGIDPVVVSSSPIKIALHLAREDVLAAARALHAAFGLEAPDAIRAHERMDLRVP